MLQLFTDLEVRVREFGRSIRREDGATAVEYGLMVALIAVAIIATVALLGGSLNGVFNTVKNTLPYLDPHQGREYSSAALTGRNRHPLPGFA